MQSPLAEDHYKRAVDQESIHEPYGCGFDLGRTHTADLQTCDPQSNLDQPSFKVVLTDTNQCSAKFSLRTPTSRSQHIETELHTKYK